MKLREKRNNEPPGYQRQDELKLHELPGQRINYCKDFFKKGNVCITFLNF